MPNRSNNQLDYELASLTAQNYPGLAPFISLTGEVTTNADGTVAQDNRAFSTDLLTAEDYTALVENVLADSSGVSYSSLEEYYAARNERFSTGALTPAAQNIPDTVIIDNRVWNETLGFVTPEEYTQLQLEYQQATLAQRAYLAEHGAVAANDILADSTDVNIAGLEVDALAADLQTLMARDTDGVRFGVDTDGNGRTDGLLFDTSADFTVDSKIIEVDGVQLSIQDVDNLLENDTITGVNLSDSERATLQDFMNVMKDNGVVTETGLGNIEMGTLAPNSTSAALRKASTALGEGGF
jgi:hypothetical protein